MQLYVPYVHVQTCLDLDLWFSVRIPDDVLAPNILSAGIAQLGER